MIPSPLRLAAVLLTTGLGALPVLNASVPALRLLSARPVQYSKIEFEIDAPKDVANPYDPDEISVDLLVVSPSGKALEVPCFFDPDRNVTGQWRARLTSVEPGTCETRVRVKTAAAPVAEFSAPLKFEVAASEAGGFLRAAGPWNFRLDSGKPFRGIGQNLCWESRANDDSRFFKALHEDPRFHYEYLLSKLSASGGNYFRTWMCAWNLPLEWKGISNTRRYSADTGAYNRSAMKRLDELLDLCESLDLYVMLALDHPGSYLGGDWEINLYNVKNGGPAKTAADLFTHPQAKAQYKKRLRYLVARWGYSPHIGAWEFFNEVDNLAFGVTPNIPASDVVAWHDEMSRYLSATDPYNHLITTSISHRDLEGLNRLEKIDFNQKHIYKNTAGIPEVIASYTRDYGKPYVIGEFGFEWDWSKDFRAVAPDMRRDFRLGLWLGLFSPTPVLPMSWWWEYFDEENATEDFKLVSRLNKEMLAAGPLSSLKAQWSNTSTTAYAVASGSARYALLVNPTDQPVTGTLTVESPVHEAKAWDTKTQTEIPVTPALKATIAPHSETVLSLR